MTTITLKSVYPGSFSLTLQYTCPWVTGLDYPDDVQVNGEFGGRTLEGGYYEKAVSFQRLIQIHIGNLTDLNARAFLEAWIRCPLKYIQTSSELVRVELKDPSKYEDQWEQNSDAAPYYVLDLIEADPRVASSDVPEWQVGTVIPPPWPAWISPEYPLTWLQDLNLQKLKDSQGEDINVPS